jgi:uncharacterized membrane-anchored protein
MAKDPRANHYLKKIYEKQFGSAEKRNLWLFMLMLLFTVIIAYFDAVQPATGHMARVQGAGSRAIPRVLLVLNLMIMAYYTFKVQFGLSKSPFLFKSLLLAFFGFFVV